MNDVEFEYPPGGAPHHREVARIASLAYRESFTHPRTGDHFVEHIFFDGRWVWLPPGFLPPHLPSWDHWPWLIWFSDGTIGLAASQHVIDAVQALPPLRVPEFEDEEDWDDDD